MPTPIDSGVIAHAIQLAIAPVFLLTGIAGLIGVMANRLARVIDRARYLQSAWPAMTETHRANARTEVTDLERRRHLASWSINFCTFAALLVCLVIMALFVEEFYSTHVQVVGRRAVRARDAVPDRRAVLVPARGVPGHAVDPHRHRDGQRRAVSAPPATNAQDTIFARPAFN